MTDKDTIIQKIKKLIALGTNNTNENEVAAALAKAAELALRNNLDLECINKSEGADNEIGKYQVKDEHSASIPGSTRLLWARLAGIFGCTAILERGLYNGKQSFVLSIVAPRGLRETIIYLGTYLERTMKNNWNQHRKDAMSWSSGFSLATRRERYMRGFAEGVTNKARIIFHSQNPDAGTLVLAHKEKVLDLTNEIAPRKTRPTRIDSMDADFSHGHQDGFNTDIRRALNAMD
ncbi:MAG: DUF2786 domain-containing protein, partial [Victivallales bacterium]|nr:DUF2786 domain-containing protein [Victivallales bacterium]